MPPNPTKLLFRQLFDQESCTYTYLIADNQTREALLIDPVKEHTNRDLQLIQELQLQLKYLLETHVHADHITGAGLIRQTTQAKIVSGAPAGVQNSDIAIEDGRELFFGQQSIRALATPGHTDACFSYYTNGLLFSGDALLIRGCGRTDFQNGSAAQLYDSVTTKLFTLPDDTLVYPGHQYDGQTVSTIQEEKQHNPRLGQKTKQEFIAIMAALKLPLPQKINEALPANLNCGLPKDSQVKQ